MKTVFYCKNQEIMEGMRCLLLFVACIIGTCHGDVITPQFPINTVGQVGEELLLNCTVDLNGAGVLQWEANFLNGDPIDKAIYAGHTNGGTISTEFIGTYEVDQDNLHNLKALDMSYDKAGRYKCSIIDDSGSPPSQEVQVAAVSELKCPESGSEYVEGDTPVLECSVEINGDPSLTPILTWERDGTAVEGIPGITTAPPPPSPRPVSLRHNLTVEYTDDAVPYTCRLRFDEGSELESTPPVYTDACTTSFSVLFGVRDVTTYPAPEHPHINMEVGENVTCNALGTAPISYFWTKIEGNAEQDLLEGQMLMITDQMIIGLNRYNCTARNSLGDGQQYSASSDTISFYVDHAEGSCGIVQYTSMLMCTLVLLVLSLLYSQ